MLLAALYLVLALDVDKILAGDARILENLYIISDVHRSENVVVAIDKPGEMLVRPCGQGVVVDEDVMAHAQLGNSNLLIIPGTPPVNLRSKPTTWYLSSASKCSIVWMELSTETGSLVYTTKRSFPLTWVSTT
jgi:hypothetical protein